MSREEGASAAPAPVFDLLEEAAEPVFVVDDDESILKGMARILSQAGYDVHEFTAPSEALALVREGLPKVMVTDLDMPRMSGLELAERAMQVDPEIKIVVITGVGDEQTAQAALRQGVTDYLIKPIDRSELVRSVQRAFLLRARDEYTVTMEGWLADEVRQRTETIRRVSLSTLDSLLNIIEARSPYFRGHSRSVADCAVGIAGALGLDRDLVASVRNAGLLHDIGMMAIPDEILNRPAALDTAEYEAVRAHTRRGAEILAPMEHLEPAITFILEHHERLDGSGYPDGKKGDEISTGGQIVALAEAWTALTEERPYRARPSRAESLSVLSAAKGRWFSADLLAALRASLA